MILEIAQVDIKPGWEERFEESVARTRPLFQRAKGFHSFQLRKVVEVPCRYHLVVTWRTLENHTVDFFGSDDFREWRRLVGPCFERIPYVEHSAEVLRWSLDGEAPLMKARPAPGASETL